MLIVEKCLTSSNYYRWCCAEVFIWMNEEIDVEEDLLWTLELTG